jgi:hypothetical protein
MKKHNQCGEEHRPRCWATCAISALLLGYLVLAPVWVLPMTESGTKAYVGSLLGKWSQEAGVRDNGVRMLHWAGHGCEYPPFYSSGTFWGALWGTGGETQCITLVRQAFWHFSLMKNGSQASTWDKNVEGSVPWSPMNVTSPQARAPGKLEQQWHSGDGGNEGIMRAPSPKT